jgi:hypothetical protein
MGRPLAFGVRLRDKGRTLRLNTDARNPGRYVVEETRDGRSKKQRDHASLGGALRDLAASWRKRLH